MTDNEIIPRAAIHTPSGEVLELGTWMGRKQAFAEIAGRCSAADAECLRRLRNQKQYRRLKLTWREFCKHHLGISRSAADQVIQRLEEFGPAYFVLAQATGIKPEEYRRISSAVHGQNLLHAGEEIPINADNAPRLNGAIEALRRETAPALPGAEPACGVDPAVAKMRAEMRGEVAREFERAARAMRAALQRYKRLAARRLESHLRTALLADLRLFAASLNDLYDDTRLR